ncbi:hypothetical protein O181_008949 [Austropuccinia psidii MF-1]|uniref:Uncharacterized protein n=1 Tax=Austropuccinia psidii MF-1 TaxID=1389203 RepID=A0A9Q3BPV8_9BASI|nr:hypothetical protein [Austropuccinia psidii MF-1]
MCFTHNCLHSSRIAALHTQILPLVQIPVPSRADIYSFPGSWPFTCKYLCFTRFSPFTRKSLPSSRFPALHKQILTLLHVSAPSHTNPYASPGSHPFTHRSLHM